MGLWDILFGKDKDRTIRETERPSAQEQISETRFVKQHETVHSEQTDELKSDEKKLLKERCIYCRSEIYYTGTEYMVKCARCGKSVFVAQFESEINRLQQAQAESEWVKQELDEAENARRDAEARLKKTIDTLDGIKDGQDVLSRLMQSVMAGQESSEDKLAKLQDIAGRILKNQDNYLEGISILSEIQGNLSRIGLDARKSQDYAKEFMEWFQDIHEDDISRLKELDAKSSELLAGQKAITDKIDFLRSASSRTRQKIDAFHSQWKESQLRELQQLYHQAENYQHDRMYDKAYDKYEQIVIKGGGEAEVLWRMLLCHYCVSYQANDQGELIPIILNPDLTAPGEMSLRKDLRSQLEKAPEDVKEVYRTELKRIDKILGELRYVKLQEKYDVFISVKQKEGRYFTSDYKSGAELFDALTRKGLKVFNSEKTKPPGGKEYEPYIISALISAKAMIVVGTCRENMEAPWVKNEWSRFQWLMKSEKKTSGKTDRILLCYLTGGMEPEQIPLGLNPSIQAIKDGINAEKDIDAALRHLFPQKKTSKENIQQEAPTSKESLEMVLDQMDVCLLTGDFSAVLKKHNSLKAVAPYMYDPRFHLNALCAQKQVEEIDQLAQFGQELKREALFKLALKFSKGTEMEEQLKAMAAPKGNVSKGMAGKEDSGSNEDGAVRVVVFAKGAKLEEARKAGADYAGGEDLAKKISDDGWLDFDVVVATPDMMSVVGRLAYILGPKGLLPSPRKGTITMEVAKVVRELKAGKEKDFVMVWSDSNLEKKMREITGIKDRDIMNSDVMDITELDLSNSQITDISSLKDMKKLESLDLSGNSLTDIAALAGLTNLKILLLINNKIKVINSLGALTKLENLWLNMNQIEDIDCLARLTKLAYLHLEFNRIKDVRCLVNLENLKDLDLSKNLIQDISCLTQLKNLLYLGVRNNPIQDYTPLADLNVRRLYVEDEVDPFKYDATLTDVGPNKIKAIVVIRQLLNLGLTEAKQFADSAPRIIKKGLSRKEAEEIKAAFEAVGAEVTITRGSEVSGRVGAKEEAKASDSNGEDRSSEGEKAYQKALEARNQGDDKTAFRYFLKAGKQGHADAQIFVGWCYENGCGVEKNAARAVDWYRKAAEQGETVAQCNLGLCYEFGKGIGKDMTQAVVWYRKAAEQGLSDAQCNLGLCYEYGQGIGKDMTQAVAWYRKAAERGYARAQCNLGLCYDNGRGIEKDEAEAMQWYLKAADQGYDKAQFCVGWNYEHGCGIEKNEVQAVAWYRKAADQGYADAQCNLAGCYAHGTGIEKDEAQAVYWYRKAAEQGSARGQNALGWRYDNGCGVEKNEAQAVYWYRKSAEQGYAFAQYNLGLCYQYGTGIEKDQAQAVAWYRKAAEQGYADAQCNLALCYVNGTGIETNYEQAVYWYRKAAEQGSARGQAALAWHFENGIGVEEDKSLAIYWYEKAAAQGNESAKQALEILKSV